MKDLRTVCGKSRLLMERAMNYSRHWHRVTAPFIFRSQTSIKRWMEVRTSPHYLTAVYYPMCKELEVSTDSMAVHCVRHWLSICLSFAPHISLPSTQFWVCSGMCVKACTYLGRMEYSTIQILAEHSSLCRQTTGPSSPASQWQSVDAKGKNT